MAGHLIHSRESPTKFLERENQKLAENSLAQIREKSSPANPIPNQPRCAHVLRIAADTNQPLTRAPTRTPCGEAGSEGSWLRVLGRPTKAARKIVLIVRQCKCPETNF